MHDRGDRIEKGKIANLVITKGELFDDRTKIEMIFVDGKKYTPAADTTPGGRGPATDEPENGMNLGTIWLGRMGSNIVRHLLEEP
jgi:hypothetical protein